jgi:hypothetical protein
MFGFRRGAYCAAALARLLGSVGVLWDTVKVSGPSEPDAPAEGAGNYLRADRPADAPVHPSVDICLRAPRVTDRQAARTPARDGSRIAAGTLTLVLHANVNTGKAPGLNARDLALSRNRTTIGSGVRPVGLAAGH